MKKGEKGFLKGWKKRFLLYDSDSKSLMYFNENHTFKGSIPLKAILMVDEVLERKPARACAPLRNVRARTGIPENHECVF